MVFNCLVNGIVLGLTYGLIAIGLTLLLSVLRVFNFAHGELYMLGAVATYYINVTLGINYIVSIILSILIVGIIGIVIERILFRKVRGQLIASLVISLGLSLFIAGGTMIIFGEKSKGVPTVAEGSFEFLNQTVSMERITVAAASIILILGLHLFLKRTKLGIQMRATAQNSEAAALMGVNIDQVSSVGFAIAAALAAAAGALIAPLFFVSTSLGGPAIERAIVVIVLGGMGSIPGAILGGLLLGLINSFAASYLGGVSEMISFVFVIIILLLRPQGLVGVKGVD